jgi:hypothetical protein
MVHYLLASEIQKNWNYFVQTIHKLQHEENIFFAKVQEVERKYVE